MALPLVLRVDGHELPARSLGGRDAVGELFRVTVEALNPESVALLGQKFSLAFGEITISGLVMEVTSSIEEGARHATLALGPRVESLALGQSSAVFQDLTVVEIVKKVLHDRGLADGTDAKWLTKRSYTPRPYTVQHRESDWAFVERLLAEEGLYYHFAHEADGTAVVFGDDSTTAETLGPLSHRMQLGVRTKERWVTVGGARAELAHDAVHVRDRDPQKPALRIDGKATSRGTAREVYAWPGRTSAPAAAATRAKTILEALQSSSARLTGTSGTTAVRPGLRFEVAHHPVAARNGPVFCTSVTWSVEQAGGEVDVRWTAIPAAVPFRLPWREPARRPLGPEPVTIVGGAGQEIDVDARGDVVVQPVWDRQGKKNERSSRRVRVGQLALAHSMTLPRTGWSMLVSHHDDDVDRPWVVARLVDGSHLPPYKLPANMTRSAWQTLTSPSDGTKNELRFEDQGDKEEIFLGASRDLLVDVGDNDAWTIGHSDSLTVGGNQSVKIGADDKLTVKLDQSTTVKGKDTLQVDGSRSITVKGAETSSVGGSRTVAVTKDLTCDVDGKRSVTVGAVMSTRTDEGLRREALGKKSVTVAGATTTRTDRGLVMTVKGDVSETVAGAKSETGKTGVQTLVKGDMTEAIAGAYMLSAKGSIAEASKGKMTLQAGAALTATAAKIEIEAKSEITVVVGGTTLTIKSGSVELKTSALACAGPMITNTGATVKHNP